MLVTFNQFMVYYPLPDINNPNGKIYQYLSQLLSTWVVHDLNHIAQIARVLAKQYKNETGPWIEYLPVLTK